MKFAAIRKWKGASVEQVIEFFKTQEEAIAFVRKQPQPKCDEFVWMVGEFN